MLWGAIIMTLNLCPGKEQHIFLRKTTYGPLVHTLPPCIASFCLWLFEPHSLSASQYSGLSICPHKLQGKGAIKSFGIPPPHLPFMGTINYYEFKQVKFPISLCFPFICSPLSDA